MALEKVIRGEDKAHRADTFAIEHGWPEARTCSTALSFTIDLAKLGQNQADFAIVVSRRRARKAS